MFVQFQSLLKYLESLSLCDILFKYEALNNFSYVVVLLFVFGITQLPKHEYMYTLNGQVLKEVDDQKDLGVHISNTLLPKKHVDVICKKANQRIGLIRRCFTDLTSEKVKKLYTVSIRSLLEYCSPAWSPYHKQDINKLEAVQRRCLKLATSEVDMPSLAERRNEIDLKETYKFLGNMYKSPPEAYFRSAQLQLRGHSRKLQKNFSRREVRKNFFSNRVVDKWNELPEKTVNATSLAQFKIMRCNDP